MKPTIWIFSIEPLETRYTAQWHRHFPELLTNKLGDKFNVVQIDGIQRNTTLTPGAFLNFSDTNYWKSSQLCNFLDQHNNSKTTSTDHFIFTDAWNPTIIQIKYMKELLGVNWKIHGLFHAGSWDKEDFLGRLIGDAPWVRHAEKSFYHAIDHNYFATQFHIDMFNKNLFDDTQDTTRNDKKFVRTGWPMEYMEDTLAPYKDMPKRDLILFPHRIAPEKQVEIFRNLKESLPQYEFVVCQDQQLTKNEYHNLLGEAKMVFSCSLQETLGIGCYEGALVDAIPLVPDRLSYTEMYYNNFKYDSRWTEDYRMYDIFKPYLCAKIIQLMTNYEQQLPQLRKQAADLSKYFFNADVLMENIK